MLFVRLIDRAFAKGLGGRGDGTPNLRYFKPSDFGVDGEESFEFLSGENVLRGARYYVKGKPIKGLLIFFHGLGAGHTAYSQQIAAFAKQGYMVYAYDNTGCMISSGKDMVGLPMPLFDQRNFFQYLDRQEDVASLKRYAVGHSWGGYAAFGALKEEYHIEKVVSLAGFRSALDTTMQRAPALRKMKGLLKYYFRKRFGEDGVFDGLEMMKKTNKPVMYVQGENDAVVPFEACFLTFQKELEGHDNISFLRVPKRAHQPYWTEDAQKYYADLFGVHHFHTLDRDPSFAVDYSRLMADDEKVLQAIFDFLAD